MNVQQSTNGASYQDSVLLSLKLSYGQSFTIGENKETWFCVFFGTVLWPIWGVKINRDRLH